MTFVFDNLYPLFSCDWLADDTEAERVELQAESDAIQVERDLYFADKQKLESDGPIDRDHAALLNLPRRVCELAQRELKFRNRRSEYHNLFARDRSAENVAATKRLDDTMDRVRQELRDMGYIDGQPATPGAFTPEMVMRHPDVYTARIYAHDLMHTGTHHPENLMAIANLERQLNAVMKSTVG